MEPVELKDLSKEALSSLESYIARRLAQKALRKDPKYKQLLVDHRTTKKHLRGLEGNRKGLWRQIQEMRDQAYQQALWNLNEKKEETNAK